MCSFQRSINYRIFGNRCGSYGYFLFFHSFCGSAISLGNTEIRNSKEEVQFVCNPFYTKTKTLLFYISVAFFFFIFKI